MTTPFTEVAVYNHVADRERIISEIARLDSMTG